MVSHPVQEF